MCIRWPRILTPTDLSQIIRKQKNPLTALQIFNEAKYMYPSYRHNGPVYQTMVGILGNSGRISEMKEVINQMKNDSCECKDSVFVAAMKTYARAGLMDEAFSLFKNIPEFNCVNWTMSFNTILQIMVNELRFDDARCLFLENCCKWEVSSRIRSLNLFMSTLCEKGRSDVALKIFLEMDYQGCCPDRESYRILMKGLCQDGRLNEGTHLLYSMFWRISQKGSGEDVIIYRTLLDALCDNGQVEEAVEVLGKILRKGLKAPNRSRFRIDITQCSNVQDVEAIKRLLNEALIKGGIPSLASFSAMAIDLYMENKITDADKVVKEMQDTGFRPTLSVYEAKLAALCRESEVDEAVKVIEVEMVKAHCVPTVKLYNIVLRGLCDGGKSALAVGYLRKMVKQVGCVPDKETYDILVDGLCLEGKFIEANRVLEEMLIKSYWPCVDTFNILIRGLCSVGRQYEGVMLLEEMINQGKLPEQSVWNSLVTSLCSNIVNNYKIYTVMPMTS
ncbi:pentatricopeptide repeat-containing protein At1g05600 [Cannabis sativa]|uniref:pentatricopeptide repeat-containing protein At1g05600 n=1 Tax=Cannabis sativa TaxID=3483 RepID=UPI0029C9BE8D|nr:pentatricopeptide repeat-containing protein At1g05600 [Cannabis sativa]XP_060967182.1 pentatricopeptide repeat-containing protein At1g05600 [Cannabis sativa]XP_060967183.1 pentatricopeptide repeat-containing protein At1g05600 [Cannabis sativa]XP_060967184.1 pentatricopeptide repeat-containing protein At1g05600 [Cannabis sativa]XP_060967185.1 pentatricopeptide repeat-containing protein At1g05600 [Cannabis sativa]XP_060967186.1 pentatricopeptide repeat-containing protein At1g05600 [Cannabis s